MNVRLSATRALSGCLLIAGLLSRGVSPASAQESPPVPAPSIPPVETVVDPLPLPATPREAALEERVRQLEEMVQRLSVQMSQNPVGMPAGGMSGGVTSGGTPAPGEPGGPASANTDGSAAEDNTPGGTNTEPVGSGPGGNQPNATPSQSGGPLAPGQSSPPNPPPSSRFRMPATTINSPLKGKFGPGFELKTDDDEFVLQFHALTQFDGRFYEQSTQDPVKDTFVFPRAWWMFSGRITKPFEYFLSFADGFDDINVLDVFLNIHYDDRLQFKIGRFKTPFTYEFYTEPIQGLISPERSLFFNNFALNRSLGMQAWGRLFNKTVPLDYAVGIFNNTRNSFLDTTSDQKNVLAYLNWRPFALLENSLLENFVFGGSVMAGNQDSPPNPRTLRTVVPTSGNAAIGIPFLAFNPDARERGPRAFWSLHAAWYHKQLSLIAEWQSGYQDYVLSTNVNNRTRAGVQSYYVQAGYFLTGENVSGRNVVKPYKDFDIRKGRFGLGAIELTGRFNALNIERNIFTAGLADPNLWTSNLYTVEPGVNWYLNQYLKVVFAWNYAVFGNPVRYSPTGLHKTSDLFLLRFQLYF